MSSSNTPPLYPLQGVKAVFDCALTNASGKLSDAWLHREYQKLLLLLDQAGRENRKRIRNVGDFDADSEVIDRDSTESCDDMAISDTDCSSQLVAGPGLLGVSFRENSLAHPPKRRLTSVLSPTASAGMVDTETPVSLAMPQSRPQPPATEMHPRTPTAMESPTTTPVSDIEEQPQQLPLPSPSASPVQSGHHKTSVYDLLDQHMSHVPTTQGELVDMVLGILGYLSDRNRTHLVYLLLQNINRLLLSTLLGLIHANLKRDLVSNLPLEIAYNILGHLDHRSLLLVAQVCTNWNRIVNNTALWTNLLRKDRLVTDSASIDDELANPTKLVNEWASSHGLRHLNLAQILYKKRSIILRRWMDPSYEPKRISVPGHGSNVVTCLQHDDDKIITGIDDKSINIYSTKTGELLKVLKGHEGGVWALKYTGNTLVSGSTDRTVRVWNIATGRCTHVFKGHTSTVRCLDILHPVKIGKDDKGEDIYFPEVPYLVTGSRDHNLHVWKLPLTNETDEFNDAEQETYDIKQPTSPYKVCTLLGHTQLVRSVTGHGNIIISGSYDTTVRVWDLMDGGRCRHVLRDHSDRIYLTALNFATKRCYSGSMDSLINVWDFEKGELLYTLEGHSSLVGLLELSDDYLVSAAADTTLRVWDPLSAENYSKLKGHSEAITCFQHDNLRIVSGSKGMLKLWDIKTGKFVRDLLADITENIWQVRFDCNRCVAAVQRSLTDSEETFIEILDFSSPPGNGSTSG